MKPTSLVRYILCFIGPDNYVFGLNGSKLCILELWNTWNQRIFGDWSLKQGVHEINTSNGLKKRKKKITSAAPMERGATRPVSFLQKHQYDGNQRPDKERKQVFKLENNNYPSYWKLRCFNIWQIRPLSCTQSKMRSVFSKIFLQLGISITCKY